MEEDEALGALRSGAWFARVALRADMRFAFLELVGRSLRSLHSLPSCLTVSFGS